MEYTEEFIKELNDFYNQFGETQASTAKHFGISTYQMSLIFKRYLKAKIPKLKFVKNENYFEIIDSSTKAYLFGLMCADGNIGSTKLTINLIVQERDKELCSLLSTEITGEERLYSIVKSSEKRYVRFSIVNRKLHTDLNNLGCVPQKTFKLTFPLNTLPEAYYKDFIRGYMDGDGCIYHKAGRATVDFVGTLNMCENFKKIIDSACGATGSIRAHKSIFVLRYNGIRQSEKVLRWLYSDTKDFLHRKYQKYLDICEQNKELDGYMDQTKFLTKRVLMTQRGWTPNMFKKFQGKLQYVMPNCFPYKLYKIEDVMNLEENDLDLKEWLNKLNERRSAETTSLI